MSDVVLQLLPESATTVPTEASTFIGPAGLSVWGLPIRQRAAGRDQDQRGHLRARQLDFTAQGSYCLAFERTATRADGTPLSNTFTLAVVVGEVDPTGVDPDDCDGS